MTNAKKELIEHIEGREVELVRIAVEKRYGEDPVRFEGSLSDVIDSLDFIYDSGYGAQQLFGFIWYKDGTWSERGEYDGAEWWEHMERPPLDVEIGVSYAG